MTHLATSYRCDNANFSWFFHNNLNRKTHHLQTYTLDPSVCDCTFHILDKISIYIFFCILNCKYFHFIIVLSVCHTWNEDNFDKYCNENSSYQLLHSIRNMVDILHKSINSMDYSHWLNVLINYHMICPIVLICVYQDNIQYESTYDRNSSIWILNSLNYTNSIRISTHWFRPWIYGKLGKTS